MSNPVVLERRGNVLVVRFARPELRNPLSLAVLGRLEEILGDAETDGSVTGVVFTGAGDVFASGANLKEIAGVTGENARAFAERGQAVMNRIAALRGETVAAVNGYCFGGALDLALACRRRLASPNATFCHPGAGLGIITGWGGTQRLPRLVGEAAALELFFTASPINARRALEIRLIDKLVDDPLASALGSIGN